MNRFILFFLFFCCFCSFADAQTAQFPAQNSYGRNHLTIANIDGSPYLDSDYKVGTVTTEDGGIYKDIPLRYNCFDDVLEFSKDNAAYELQPKERIKRAEFGGKVFTYKDFESDRSTDKSFFELLVEGKATLCARFTIKFYEAEELKGFAEAKPARFEDLSETYYLSLNNAPAKKISNSKKLLEILSDKKSEVESFMSKQKVGVKKVEDLKKIIVYYNSL